MNPQNLSSLFELLIYLIIQHVLFLYKHRNAYYLYRLHKYAFRLYYQSNIPLHHKLSTLLYHHTQDKPNSMNQNFPYLVLVNHNIQEYYSCLLLLL